MWQQIIILRDRTGPNPKIREDKFIDATIDEIKLMLALAVDFSDVHEMYLHNIDDADNVSIYKVEKHKDGIVYHPVSFTDNALEVFAEDKQTKAFLNLLAFSGFKDNYKSGHAMAKILEKAKDKV